MNEKMRNDFIRVLRASKRTTREEIKALRKDGKPFYVIRYKERLYLCYNIEPIKEYLISNYQLCANCKNCIARPTDTGGCDKVFDSPAKHVYKYDFISLGVEAYTSNREENFFSVIRCKNYLPEPPRENTNVIWHGKRQPNFRAPDPYRSPKPTINIQWPCSTAK